jgi:hypothetical protein
MAKQKQVELVYPLYLDVPMMTSFLAALEDGVAYGSDIVRIQQEQRDRSAEAGGGVSAPGVLSSLFNLDLRGRITGKATVGSNEEVTVIRKHTESSLFMSLRHTLKQRNLIENLDNLQDTRKLHSLKRTSLVEITGEISRSPLSEVLEAFSRFVNLAGPQMFEEHLDLDPADQLPGQELEGEPAASEEIISGNVENSTNSGNITLLELFNRIREDLSRSRVIDVVMKPSGTRNLTIVIALALEFLPEGTLETLLSGQFTVLGKLTRVLKKDEEINLHQRTVFSFLDSSVLDEPLEGLGAEAGLRLARNPSSVKAPAIQLLPLAIYV